MSLPVLLAVAAIVLLILGLTTAAYLLIPGVIVAIIALVLVVLDRRGTRL